MLDESRDMRMAAITRSDLEEYTVVWTNGTTGAPASVTSSDLRTPETVTPSDSPWPSSDRRFSRIFIVCLSLLFLLSSTGNFTVLYIIGQHLKWRAATNVFITVLSLSDLLLAFTCVPMLFVSLVTERWVFGETGCTANVLLSRLLGLITGAMTLLLTVDRHQAVVRLIRTKFVLRRTLAVVGISCIASAALVCPWGVLVDGKTTTTQELFYRCTWGSLPVDHRVYDAVYQTVFFTGPVVFMFYCVLSLARTIRRNDVEVCPPSMHVTQLRFSGEIQTAKTVVVMVIVFAICRLPYSVVGYTGAISPAMNRVEMTEPAWTMTAQLISWASGAVNPFIYAVRNPNVAKILHLDRKAGYVSEEPLPADPSPGDRPGDAEAAIGGNFFSRSFRATKSAAAPGITKCASTGEVQINETSMNSADSEGKKPVNSCCSSVSPEVTSVYVRSASCDQSCMTGGCSESVCRPGCSSAGSSRSMSVPSVLSSVGARFVARNSLSSVSTTLTNVMI